MFLQSWKEWMVAVGVALLVYFLHATLGIWASSPTSVAAVSESYEMQRVKNDFSSDFDLSNRAIETVQIGSPVGAAGANPKASAAGAQKAIDLKGKTTANKKQKEQTKKKQEELARRQKKMNGLSVQVVDSRFKRTLSDSSSGEGSRGAVSYGTQYGAAANIAKNAAKPTDKQQDKQPEQQDQKLSAGQWFSLLQAQPNQTNARNFMKAKADLGVGPYYDIITKLLRDSQADRVHIASFILNADVSIMSFQYLVKLPEDIQKNTVVAVELQQILASYGKDKSRFGILAQALNSSDVAIVSAAMDMVTKASQKIAGDNAVASASGITGLFVKGDFNIFKTTLEKLLKSSNANISQSAKSVYDVLWQTPTVTASLQQ